MMKTAEKSVALINIGFGNVVSASHVISVVAPASSPMKRLREEASERGKLIDATQGRKTRAIIITDSDHIILSALQVETITQRFVPEKYNAKNREHKEPKSAE